MKVDLKVQLEMRSALLNCGARIGCPVGAASAETLDAMQKAGLIGPGRRLTRKGVGWALRFKREEAHR